MTGDDLSGLVRVVERKSKASTAWVPGQIERGRGRQPVDPGYASRRTRLGRRLDRSGECWAGVLRRTVGYGCLDQPSADVRSLLPAFGAGPCWCELAFAVSASRDFARAPSSIKSPQSVK